MYDIVFISYQEPNAENNWEVLKEQFPMAKRVKDIDGIHQAHITAAKKCFTKMFWVVDGDAELSRGFQFDYKVSEWDLETVHVWRSINPINDLEYGYGGVKLLPRSLTLNMDTTVPDMTTSISNKFKAVDEVANITAFNTDPWSAWKSGFRECAKLSSKVIKGQVDEETEKRLDTWCTVGADREYGKYAIHGAQCGRYFGQAHKDDKEMLHKINDFKWLKEQFDDYEDSI
jgi:hypothetical protein